MNLIKEFTSHTIGIKSKMRHTDLQILKQQLISKIETELWRDTGLRFTELQNEELSEFSLHDLTLLLEECKHLETEFRRMKMEMVFL